MAVLLASIERIFLDLGILCVLGIFQRLVESFDTFFFGEVFHWEF